MRIGQSASGQAPRRPQLIQAMIDAFNAPDLRARILFTPVSYTHLTLPTTPYV